MKMKFFGAIAAVALVAGVAFYLSRGGSSLGSAGQGVAATQNNAAQPQAAPNHVLGSPETKGGLASRRLESVSMISELQRESVQDPSAESLESLRAAAAYCEFMAVQAPVPAKIGAEGPQQEKRRVALQYQMEFAARFCDVPTKHSSDLTKELLEQEGSDALVQAMILPNLPDSEQESIGVPRALSLAGSESSPETLSWAAKYLLLRDRNLPQVAGLPFPASMASADARRDVQFLAVEMVRCNVRGGCGPNGFNTALNCGSDCRPGITLDQVWANRYSPEFLEYARELAAAIQATSSAN